MVLPAAWQVSISAQIVIQLVIAQAIFPTERMLYLKHIDHTKNYYRVETTSSLAVKGVSLLPRHS